MTQAETLAAMTEASRMVVAMIQASPGVLIGTTADSAGERASKAFAAIYSQIKKSADG